MSAIDGEKEYTLTVRFRFSAVDDFEARMDAKDRLNKIGPVNDAEVKMQRLSKNKQPEKVSL